MVSTTLTIQYDKAFFLLEPNEITKPLARKRVTISEHPDGRLVISHNGLPLPYKLFDTVRHVDQGAIVENKRLAAVLQHIQRQQALRPQYRSEHAPRRRIQNDSPLQTGVPLSRKRREGLWQQRQRIDPLSCPPFPGAGE